MDKQKKDYIWICLSLVIIVALLTTCEKLEQMMPVGI